MSNLIQFETRRRLSPVEGLLSDVGTRIGPGKVSKKERKAANREKRKAEARKASGLKRVTYDLLPGTADMVKELAKALDVPISQVADKLLDYALWSDYPLELEEIREVNTSSKRYGYTLKGAPLKKQRGTP